MLHYLPKALLLVVTNARSQRGVLAPGFVTNLVVGWSASSLGLRSFTIMDVVTVRDKPNHWQSARFSKKTRKQFRRKPRSSMLLP